MRAPEGLQIRPARMEDAEALNEIRRQESVVASTGRLSSERVQQTRDWLAALKPDDHLLVAEVDRVLAGMAALHVLSGKQRHVARVGLTVSEAFQGRGVGRALMERLLRLADKELGLVRVELTVVVDNARAVHLYESLGFQREGVLRKAFMKDGEPRDMLVMGRVR